MSDNRKKQLAYNIIDFLRTSQQDGTVKDDDKESLDVAIQCISESFGVDPDSKGDQDAYSIKPASLLSLLDVLAKTKSKAGSAPAPAAAAASSGPSDNDKSKAEALKAEGNAAMSKKDYDGAIAKYTEAIKLDPNPIYYSNRAAALGGQGKHAEAVEDAQRAIDLDPNFARGYSRLGHAEFCQGNYQKAVDAYEAGVKLDPSNANMKSSLATAKARVTEQSPASSGSRSPAQPGAGGAGGMPDLSSLADMMGGMGGGGGGMPDMASMMRNPQMMAMAQQMMANGGLERLMSNPALRNMAENMQNGGGMPDFGALAQDPAMRDLASQFMGGGGAGGAGGR